MHVISNKIPTMDGFTRRKNVDVRGLEYKLQMLGQHAANGQTNKATANALLDTNNLETICRLYKKLDFTLELDTLYIDFEAYKTAIRESEYAEIFMRWHTILRDLNYSQFTNFTQYKHPRFNVATSLPMLAAKEKCDIPYNAWKNIPLSVLFHKSMVQALENAPKEENYRKIKFSEDLLNAAKPRGDMQTHTIKSVGLKFEGADEDGDIYLWEGFDEWPIPIRHMKLQTWIFHPRFRDVCMILDPYDWDMVPPANYGMSLTPTKPSKSPDGLSDLFM